MTTPSHALRHAFPDSLDAIEECYRRGWTDGSRPSALQGKRMGLLDNSKANSDVILRTLADLLDVECHFADIFYAKKHSASLPPVPKVVADLHRHADLIITGVGD